MEEGKNLERNLDELLGVWGANAITADTETREISDGR
jgi:hypothetical protein